MHRKYFGYVPTSRELSQGRGLLVVTLLDSHRINKNLTMERANQETAYLVNKKNRRRKSIPLLGYTHHEDGVKHFIPNQGPGNIITHFLGDRVMIAEHV